MSDVSMPPEAAATDAFQIIITIAEDSLSYTSALSEPEIIFWIEVLKNRILGQVFSGGDVSS